MADSSEEEELATALIIGLLLLRRRRRRRKNTQRKYWVRPILQMRQQREEYHNLLQEMRLCDKESHFSYLRMSKETFDSQLQKVQSTKALIGLHKNEIIISV